MDSRIDLFTKFGGIRPMARAIGAKPPAVHGWKVRRRVPDVWQRTILAIASRLQMDVTAEDVMWPFPEDRAAR